MICAKCSIEIKKPLAIGETVTRKSNLKKFGYDGIELSEPEILIKELEPFKHPPILKEFTNSYFEGILRYGQFYLCLKCLPHNYSFGQKEENNSDKNED